jgi:LmbE family N-acetylglucosaminyl deacetylase
MQWIYLSPHFDDVALSCGGLIWQQVRSGEAVSIWTVCAGNAPSRELSPFAKELHLRWETDQDATSQRRLEDLRSCHRLGVTSKQFTIPDCIYRLNPYTDEFFYTSEEALNGPLQPVDRQNIALLGEEIKRAVPEDVVLVCPLSLGNHVDHQLTRLAAEGLDRTKWYYADYPYVLRCNEKLEQLEKEGWISQSFQIPQDGLVAWQDSVASHVSQISTFWKDEHEMRMALSDYLEQNQGVRLWKKPIT